ncbi:MAG: sulfatase-like hydrolase/transferase [Streptosporangiales bacterium]|nr:sulfatase-like hydrolase/transferase [Streptosporangiales bacterium]
MLARPSRKTLLTAAAAVAVLLGAAGIVVTSTGPESTAGSRPNIVFVLTDDMDSGLLRYMPQARKLQADGVSFSNYTVTNSLCCPSRASIFTGQFPHNTGVLTNNPRNGGYAAFLRNDLEKVTFGVALQEQGYRTAMMGKYLNGYEPLGLMPGAGYVPPGWDVWAVSGSAGYRSFDYTVNENGWMVGYGREPADYMTDVLSTRGNAFIRDSVDAGDPFLLEIATYAPHGPFTPAPRDAHKFPGLETPRDPSFGEPDVSDKPKWVRNQPRLSRADIARSNTDHRRRAQSMQAVDRMLGRLRATLAQTGQADNTYVVLSSDNGFHLGQHRLLTGKKTPYSTDVNVPLIVAGPGVPAGKTRQQIAENVDLHATFTDIGGKPSAGTDGRSLLPILRGRPVRGWKTSALVEHHGPNNNRSDPDYQPSRNANPPSYDALRTATSTYVEYETREREYYDRRRDPYELTNIYASLPTAKRQSLHRQLTALRKCRGTAACTKAAGGRYR